jgi:hypothetical protein
MAGTKLENKTRNKTNQNMSVRKTNPIYRNPVSRPKVNFGFDGQYLNGTGFSTPIVTLTNGAGSVYYVDCSSISTTGPTVNKYIQSVAQEFAAITKIYNEFVYHSVRMDWMPFVAPGVADGGSQIYVGYIDNAEEIATLDFATFNGTFDTAKAARNMKFFNAWERFSYTVPVTRRRKSFDTNNTVGGVLADVADRSIQGAVVAGYSSTTASMSLGQWRFTYLLELRTLNNKMVT